MQGIDDALRLVGNDSIQDLFNFVEIIYEASDINLNEEEYKKVKEMVEQIGFAIFTYAVSKEKANAKSESPEN